MEDVGYHHHPHHHHHHHHHHQHHSHDANGRHEGQQFATSFQNTTVPSIVVTGEHYQQHTGAASTMSTPMVPPNVSINPPIDGVQPAGSFHSVSSVDSAAEMLKYFPDAQTPRLSPLRHQQEVQGHPQLTTTSNRVINTNALNAGPYILGSAPNAVQQLSQSVRSPIMSQQRPPGPSQQQSPGSSQQRPPEPSQPPPGIPSYLTQVEGLSVSQTVVNDVLIDLQSKAINETLQQYHGEASSGMYLEPLPPIYIRAPQPTIILRSDLNRLRAELGNRVRPQGNYRYPVEPNQFQQHRFQQNSFQGPRFPTPQQQHIPPEYHEDYQNSVYANR